MKFNFIKKIGALLLVVTLATTLSACGDDKMNTSTPYGTISGNYASYNNVSLSNKTLYDMMRLQGYTTFSTEVEKIVLADYLAAIDYNDADDAQDLQDIINSALFGTDEVEDIFYLSADDKKATIAQIIDTLYMANVVITTTDITIKVDGVEYSNTILDYFKLDLAKKRFGEDKLTGLVDLEEVEDPNGDEGDVIDNVYFISDEDVENYYNNTYRNQQDFNAIIVGYNSIAAYEAAINNLGSNPFSESNIKNSFITLYNGAFQYKEQLTLSNFDELTILNSDKLSAYNSSLSAFVNGMEENSFTSTYKEFGDKVYMIYKITELSDLEWNELSDDANFTPSIIEEIEKEIREELYDAKLTSSFISLEYSKLINELVEDDKIKIYDPVFSNIFSNSYEYEDKGLTSTTDVASINGTIITADDLFDTFSDLFGVSIALDYFLNVSMVGNFTLTDDEKDDADDAYDAVIKSFEDNSYSNSGITSDFSESQFLSMQYGFTSKSDVIKYYFQPQEGMHYFTEDYNELYFDLFESVGENTYKQYFNLDIVHMLLFVDADMDGNLDNPEEFMRDLSDANKIKFQDTVLAIYSAVYEEASFLALGYEKSLYHIVEAYNNGDDIAYTKNGTQKTWDDIKTSQGIDFNIQMKVEDLGVVDNSNSSNYVKSFADHVENTYALLKDSVLADEEDFDDEFTKLLEKENLELIDSSTEFEELCMSSFGFHMLLSTNGSTATSAKFTQDNDYKTSDGTYAYGSIDIELNEESDTVTGYTTNDWPSIDQLKVYVAELDGDDGVYSLKSSTETIIDGLYSVFTQRYESESFIAYLLINEYDLLTEIDFEENANNIKLTDIIEISKRSIDGYTDSTTVYADWWTILNNN